MFVAAGLTACAGQPGANEGAAEDFALPPANEAASRQGASEPMETSPGAAGAVSVARSHFALLGQGRFADAWRLWSDGGRASGMSEADFAARFAGLADYRAELGEPGRIEGAAGSLYVEVPVRVSGRLANGEAFEDSGTIVLRRVNDVPGSTAEQRSWRIARTNVRPFGESGGNGQTPRFVGRWATDAESCATRAWTFTARALRTPAGSACTFTGVRAVPGGYDISARCTAEAPPADDLLQIRFAESAGAMLFESTSIADAGLVRCGGE